MYYLNGHKDQMHITGESCGAFPGPDLGTHFKLYESIIERKTAAFSLFSFLVCVCLYLGEKLAKKVDRVE